MERIFTIAEINEVAEAILRAFPAARLFYLSGDLGAGKTHLVKAFCTVLQIQEKPHSPTFSIINVYHRQNGEEVIHADLYRLKEEEDLIGTGLMEYLDKINYVFIEWPEMAIDALPEDAVRIHLSEIPDSEKRLLIIS